MGVVSGLPGRRREQRGVWWKLGPVNIGAEVWFAKVLAALLRSAVGQLANDALLGNGQDATVLGAQFFKFIGFNGFIQTFAAEMVDYAVAHVRALHACEPDAFTLAIAVAQNARTNHRAESTETLRKTFLESGKKLKVSIFKGSHILAIDLRTFCIEDVFEVVLFEFDRQVTEIQVGGVLFLLFSHLRGDVLFAELSNG